MLQFNGLIQLTLVAVKITAWATHEDFLATDIARRTASHIMLLLLRAVFMSTGPVIIGQHGRVTVKPDWLHHGDTESIAAFLQGFLD